LRRWEQGQGKRVFFRTTFREVWGVRNGERVDESGVRWCFWDIVGGAVFQSEEIVARER